MSSELPLLTALAHVSEALNTTLYLEPVLQVALEESISCTKAIGGSITLGTSDLERYRVEVAQGVQFETASYDQKLTASRQMVIAQNTAFRHANDPEQQTVATGLFIPIFFLESLTGELRLFFSDLASLTAELTVFAGTLASLITVALGNLHRYDELTARNNELHRRTLQLERLVESSRVFQGESALSEVYEDLVYAIQEAVGYNIVALSLFESTGGASEDRVARVVAGAGLPLARLKQLNAQPFAWSRVEEMMQPSYARGRAFFIPSEEIGDNRDFVELLGADLYQGQPAADTAAWQPYDLFFVPLHDSHSEPLGMISLAAPLDFTRPDVGAARVLEVFANQAATAIENVQLYDDTRAYSLQLAHLQEVTQNVLGEQNMGKRLQLLVDGLQESGWRRVTLTLHDQELMTASLISAGLTPAEHAYLQDDLLPRKIWQQYLSDPQFQQFRQGSCFFVPEEHPWALENLAGVLRDIAPVHNGPDAWRPRDLLILPIYDRNAHLVALIGLDRPVNGTRPDQRTLRSVDLFSRFATTTIENMSLIAALRSLNRELDARVAQRTQRLAEESERVTILLRINTELTASLDKDRVLNRALMLINESIGASYASILLREEGSDEFLRQAALLEEAGQLPSESDNALIDYRAILDSVLSDRRATIVNDLSADEAGLLSGHANPAYRSAMIVPLVIGEEVSGLMVLLHDRRGYFSENQLELMTAAGIQVAQAVYNAELYDLIRRQAESLGTMMRNAQVEVAKTNAMLESIADGVIVVNADDEIILVNRAACSMLGFTRNELLFARAKELSGLFGDSGGAWFDMLDQVSSQISETGIAAGRSTRIQMIGQVIDITLAPVMVRRRFIGTVSVLHDMTREAEVDRMKSEFVSTVSHELRTPMTSVKGYADLLLMGVAGQLNPQQTSYLGVIKSNADRLGFLVDDLLDISKIETGSIELNLCAMDLGKTIREVVTQHTDVKSRRLGKEIAIDLHVAPSLPLAYADPEKVRRIVTNLLENGINYTPAEGLITIAVQAVGQIIWTRIQDTGIGISEQDLTKIFTRFYRAEHEHVREVAGTGLGLSIVESLVQLQGGTVEVSSELGKGSTFSFSLPVALDSPSSDEA